MSQKASFKAKFYPIDIISIKESLTRDPLLRHIPGGATFEDWN